jgi:aprataxin
VNVEQSKIDSLKGKSLRKDYNESSSSKMKTLIFPLLSTTKYQFNVRECATVLNRVITNYSSHFKHSSSTTYRLVVRQEQLQQDSSTLLSNCQNNVIVQNQNETIIDVLRRETTNNAQQEYFVCSEVSWRFLSACDWTDSLVNVDKSILSIKNEIKSADTGSVFPVEVNDNSELKKIGIEWILHVIGPNFNPNKPNCLNDDYVKGNELLSQAYDNLFKTFFRLVEQSDNTVTASQSQTRIIFGEFNPPPSRFGVTNNRSNWQDALIDVINDQHTETNKRKIFYADDACVVMYDAFPKSTVHLLCLTVQDIHNVRELTKQHLPLLYHINNVVQQIIQHLQKQFPHLKFKAGCHSIPSMSRLHIHINSCDFITDCMKNKKHYNSFNTEFYMDINKVIQQLEQHGKVHVDEKVAEQYIKGDMKCHICHQTFKQIPQLKSHISHCLKNQSKLR